MDRREFVSASAVGLGVLGVGASVSRAEDASARRVDRSDDGHVDRRAMADGLRALVSPIGVGTAVAGVTVTELFVDEANVASISLDVAGRRSRVDIFRRDETDNNPVAATENYEFSLRNGGQGSRPTDDHVRAAVEAIAAVVRTNETSSEMLAVVTKTEYWSADYWG